MDFARLKFFAADQKNWVFNYWDMVALILVCAIIVLFAFNAKQMATPYHVGETTIISLAPGSLFFYAVRTVLRMLIALGISFLFTFTIGTLAAKNKSAEKIIIPLIDLLQSVPILGFLSVTITAFIALFPGSLLGPECAVIFVMFTSQAWNMTLSFYQTVKSVPADIIEAAKIFQLSPWQRFWRIEVPFSMPGLLWNTMLSMSAGWFLIVASEAISIAHQEILLPGIGSYISTAIRTSNLHAIGFAIIAMTIVIIIYDQLLFRPLVAWAEKFKMEQQGTEKTAESWIVNLFRRTRLLRKLGYKLTLIFNAFVNISWLRKPFTPAKTLSVPAKHRYVWQILWYMFVFISSLTAFVFVSGFIKHHLALSEIKKVFGLGLITTLRVSILIVICTLIWVPIGVWIGLRPKVAQIAQPLAQLLAAFPANLFYPLIVLLIVRFNLSANIWLTPLMILGTQWYILFNVIAGASSLPKDLLQVADNLNVSGLLRWRKLILPGIFPFYITGAITAAGGAWNASIVAEIATWGDKTVAAAGLGAYIAQSASTGNFARTSLGISMMCLLVLLLNRLVWHPLYRYATERFSLE